MRLLLSTAALSVATGGTVVTPSLRASLDTQVHQGPAAAGAECLFVNSFKLGGVSSAKGHDEGANAVDTGILSCPSAYTCVEDLSSSMGGRCVSLSHRDYSGHEELYVDAQVHRSLVACTLINGTAGTKCDGYNACARVNVDSVPCGACNGDYACARLVNVTLAEGSCNGEYACRAAESSSIGVGSCNGPSACFSVKAVTVGTGSCVGTNKTCTSVVSSTIGAASCVGNSQCSYFQGTIGNEACIGDKIKGSDGLYGFACFKASGKIGDKSCYEYGACYQPKQYNHNFVVGTNSCKGRSACMYFDPLTIGNDSCSGFYACYNMYSNVGDDSCNGQRPCESNKYPIGSDSCNGYYSCNNNLASIGDCNCNGESACENNQVPKLNNCTTSSPTGKPTAITTPAPSSATPTKAIDNPTKAPTAKPVDVPTTSAPTTMSPTHSPTTMSPTHSPTTTPTSSPSKPPTTSPTRSPTTSPTKHPSVSPSTSPTASPSKSPTVSPTLSPSVPPTVSPTRKPTLSPTNVPSSSPSQSPTFITSTSVVLEGNLVLDVNCTFDNSTLVSSAAVIRDTITETIQSTLGANQVLESVNVASICGAPVPPPLASRRLQGGGAPVSFAALLTQSCGVVCGSNPEIAQALADLAESVLTNSINGGNFTALMQTIAVNVNNTVLATAGVNNVTSGDFSSFMVTDNPTSSPTKRPTNAPTRKPVSVTTSKPTFVAKSSKTTPRPTTKPTMKPSPKPVGTKGDKRQRRL